MPASQVVLITGATAGIGRHTALALARRGHHVIATGRKREALDRLAEEAKAAGGELSVLTLDVTDEAAVQAAVLAVGELTGGRGVDALVNNAGFGHVGPVEETSGAEVRAMYETNVFGLLAVTRAFLPGMRRRGAGRIINVSSLGGRLTMPFFGVYNSTKFAVESLSDALRLELAPFNIQVALIEPGPILSDFADRAMHAVPASETASPFAAVYARSAELREQTDRMSGQPEDVTRAIAAAIEARSPRARYAMTALPSFFVALLRSLPTALTDWLLRQSLGLTRARLAARPKALPSAS